MLTAAAANDSTAAFWRTRDSFSLPFGIGSLERSLGCLAGQHTDKKKKNVFLVGKARGLIHCFLFKVVEFASANATQSETRGTRSVPPQPKKSFRET